MNKTAAEIIEKLGGPTKVARLCKTTPQTVCHWKHGKIPNGYMMYLQVVRPDVFQNEGAAKPACSTA